MFFSRLFNSSFWALLRKEINQILRDKQLIILLIVPPTMQLLLYGFALNPDVHNLKLGVIDYANVNASRELIQAMTSNSIFSIESVPTTEKDLSRQVEEGKLNLGVIIPPEFPRKLATKEAEIQVFIDGVDANAAGIASGYMTQIIQNYNRNFGQIQQNPPVSLQVVFLYNPGLISSWYFVPGVMGLVLTLVGTLVSSVAVVREKDSGTLEQLLMTPAANWEILLSKILPLAFLLMGDILLALTLGQLVFGLPLRGNFLLFFWAVNYISACWDQCRYYVGDVFKFATTGSTDVIFRQYADIADFWGACPYRSHAPLFSSPISTQSLTSLYCHCSRHFT